MNPQYIGKVKHSGARVSFGQGWVFEEDYTPKQLQNAANLLKALKTELKPLNLKITSDYSNEYSVGKTPQELLSFTIHPKGLLNIIKPSTMKISGPTSDGIVLVQIQDEKRKTEIQDTIDKLRKGLDMDFRYTESISEVRKRVKKSQEHYFGNTLHLDALLINERGYVSKEPYKENVVVLCSGGLDSVVMINKLIEDYETIVYPLFIKRGAKAEKFEEKAFDFFVDFYTKKFPKNFKDAKKLNFEIPPKELKENFPKSLALTQGHPLRNSTMQNLAVMYAVSLAGSKGLEIKSIFSASTKDDNIEPEQGLLSLRAQTLSTCTQLGDWKWNLTSPLTDPYMTEKSISKADLIKYALNKFIPLEKTRTCFSNEKIADGTCIACQKRLKAFDYLKMSDPLKYQTREVVI